MENQDRIKLAYGRLRNSERKVADYILENKEKIRHMTLRQMQDEIGVSQPTIMRFVQAVGYDGFQEFKNVLWMEAAKEPNAEKQKKSITKLQSIPEKISCSIMDSLTAFVKEMNMDQYATAIRWLHKAKTIDVYGAENSVCVATDLAGKLLHLGMCCRSNTDTFYPQIGAEHLSKQDVAVGISWTGRTKMTVDAMRIAKHAGAKCMVITGKQDSPITEFGDIIFVLPSAELVDEGIWITSRVLQIAFCDMLYAGLVKTYPKTYCEKLEKSGNMMTDHMYL